MKKRIILNRIAILVCLMLFWNLKLFAGDTCTFMLTANDVPPNIVILLDNGASMEEIVWHPDFDNSENHSPVVQTGVDIVQYGHATGNGFFRAKGYSIVLTGSKYYIVEVPDSLNVAGYQFTLQANGDGKSPTWTINGKTLTLPAVPSNSPSSEGVIDKAPQFRYSKNYLNWLFYGPYSGNGTDLPAKTRFYFAKKALMTVAKMASNKTKFSIYNFTSNANGASNVQPLSLVVNTPLAASPESNTLDSNYVNNLNNMNTVTYSPLAEGLASIGGYYDSPSSKIVDYYCTENFVIVISPGMSSEDKAVAAGSFPTSLNDFDGDGSTSGIGEGNIRLDGTTYSIQVGQNGTTYLDDVAAYLYKNDVVGYRDGFQNLRTYTVGFMGDFLSNLFLINTSNNGNGNFSLYDSTHKDYAKYHYVAQNPDQLSSSILAAITDIIAQTNSFTAPVVPVTRTTSGNKIYMAFFKPNKGKFWEGNVTKFGLSYNLEIVDKTGLPATWPNGAIREDAQPYWQTKDWATPGKTNYIHNSNRKIYTYLGVSRELSHESNGFTTSNITASMLGNPTNNTTDIVNFVRGADAFDENNDLDRYANRALITGDVLHSEPAIFNYNYSNGASKSYVFFGSNDGMLHAVFDAEVSSAGVETHHGKEAWSFIPPELLPRLKEMVEGAVHAHYVDSSPKIHFKDSNKNGIIDTEDKVILVCGLRKGGSSYFALDVTEPDSPRLLWRASNTSSQLISPDVVIAELGQSWSEPQFGLVRTSDLDVVGTTVLFIGGGYSSNNSNGKAILVMDLFNGQVLRTFKNSASITGMNYSIPSNIAVIDSNDNGFIDKLYVGDLGSQVWRIGKFTNSTGALLRFPECNENVNTWEAHVVFFADSTNTRRFFYPPSVTLERGYDLLFIGSGDRENACATGTNDRFYAIRDQHKSAIYNENDLVDITNPISATPFLDKSGSYVNNDGREDQGWFYTMSTGEKILSESTVFYKTVYFTSFVPDTDPCVPGGMAKLYALNYKTSTSVIDFDQDGIKERSTIIGGGIPSKPVMVLTDKMAKMIISVGSTNPDINSDSFAAGVIRINPLMPPINFFYQWWHDINNL